MVFSKWTCKSQESGWFAPYSLSFYNLKKTESRLMKVKPNLNAELNGRLN